MKKLRIREILGIILVLLIVGVALYFSVQSFVSTAGQDPSSNKGSSSSISILNSEPDRISLQNSVSSTVNPIDMLGNKATLELGNWGAVNFKMLANPREILESPEMMQALHDYGMTDEEIYLQVNELLYQLGERPVDMPIFEPNGMLED